MDFNEISQDLLRFCKTIVLLNEDDHEFNIFLRDYIHISFEKNVAIKRQGLEYLIPACKKFLAKTKKGRPLSDITSEDYIEGKFIELAINAFFKHQNEQDAFIMKELKKFYFNLKLQEYLFYFGIGNLKVQNEYRFGRITIFPNTNEKIERYFGNKDKGKSVIENLTKDSETLKKEGILSFAAVRCFTVDSQKGLIVAQSILRQHLNVLQTMHREGIFIEGDPTRNRYNYRICDSDNNLLRIGGGDKNGGNYHIPFDFDDFFNHNERLIKKLDSAFRSVSEGSLQQKIIISLDWLGDSRFENNDHHRITKLMISLESLLLDKSDKIKRPLLEERSGFLYSKKYNERIYAKTLVGDSYILRNDIVHTGNKEEPISSIFLEKVTKLIFTLNLIVLFEEKFGTLTDVKKYVEKEKYGNGLT